MNSPIKTSKIEFFCGTGGVGKTTLSASRALYLANFLNQKVILMTIDPSLRLKDLFQIKEAGIITHTLNMDVLLFSPTVFLLQLFKSKGLNLNEFRPLKILSGSHGGLNEILSVVKISQLISENHYDTIVIDTAPGEHFLDFLEGLDKIKNFFTPTLSAFLKFSSEINKSKLSFIGDMFQSVAHAGIEKAIGVIEKLTGSQFIQEFRQTLVGIFSLKDLFLSSLNLFQDLSKEDKTTFYLVTTIEHHKKNELLTLRQSLQNYKLEQFILLLNRTTKSSHLAEELHQLTSGEWKVYSQELISREESWTIDMQEHFFKVLSFPRISRSIDEQNQQPTILQTLNKLALQWKLGE